MGKLGAKLSKNAYSMVAALGILSAFVGSILQGRSWDYTHQVDNIAKDSDAVLNALHDLNSVIDVRWLAINQLNDAYRNKLGGDRLKNAQDSFSEANRKWELAHNNLSAAFEITVDSPFSVDGADKIRRVPTLDCKDYDLSGGHNVGTNPISARVLLEISDHCITEIKNDLEKTAGASQSIRKPIPSADFEVYQARIDFAWRVNKVLQCLTTERAEAVRANFPTLPFLDHITTVEPHTVYVVRTENEDKCLALYSKEKRVNLDALVR